MNKCPHNDKWISLCSSSSSSLFWLLPFSESYISILVRRSGVEWAIYICICSSYCYEEGFLKYPNKLFRIPLFSSWGPYTSGSIALTSDYACMSCSFYSFLRSGECEFKATSLFASLILCKSVFNVVSLYALLCFSYISFLYRN